MSYSTKKRLNYGMVDLIKTFDKFQHVQCFSTISKTDKFKQKYDQNLSKISHNQSKSDFNQFHRQILSRTKFGQQIGCQILNQTAQFD